jgi:AbrB family looped-hinge helix DNA binding protein
MATSKVSPKYQIVIPKGIREKLGIQAGMEVTIEVLDNHHAVIRSGNVSYAKKLRGLGKEVWQSLGGTEAYIKRERSSWGER